MGRRTGDQPRRAVLSSRPDRRHALWAGLLLLGLALVLYLLTLDNGLQPGELAGGDLITHQYAQVEARPSNAPGYPLYTMGGWLWFHGLRALFQATGAPLPNPIPLLSSYSLAWALLALGLLYAILCRLTRTPSRPAGNWPLAWLVSAFYTVTYFFWYYATTTEQYTSAIAQTLAMVWVYLVWEERQAEEKQAEEKQLSTVNSQLSIVNEEEGLPPASPLDPRPSPLTPHPRLPVWPVAGAHAHRGVHCAAAGDRGDLGAAAGAA